MQAEHLEMKVPKPFTETKAFVKAFILCILTQIWSVNYTNSVIYALAYTTLSVYVFYSCKYTNVIFIPRISGSLFQSLKKLQRCCRGWSSSFPQLRRAWSWFSLLKTLLGAEPRGAFSPNPNFCAQEQPLSIPRAESGRGKEQGPPSPPEGEEIQLGSLQECLSQAWAQQQGQAGGESALLEFWGEKNTNRAGRAGSTASCS